MQNYTEAFLEFAISHNVLQFGEFTLKSGRKSPYFFNAGLFHSGHAIRELGRFYAEAIIKSDINFDLLFGPAYKGIPLATATAIALADQHNKDLHYAFNRKETKSHGEGGNFIGAPLQGRILIIDDVITAGTAINQALAEIVSAGAEPVGVVIALNRQERSSGKRSAIQEVETNHNIPVISIANLGDLLEFTRSRQDYSQHLKAIEAYQAEYGT